MYGVYGLGRDGAKEEQERLIEEMLRKQREAAYKAGLGRRCSDVENARGCVTVSEPARCPPGSDCPTVMADRCWCDPETTTKHPQEMKPIQIDIGQNMSLADKLKLSLGLLLSTKAESRPGGPRDGTNLRETMRVITQDILPHAHNLLSQSKSTLEADKRLADRFRRWAEKPETMEMFARVYTTNAAPPYWMSDKKREDVVKKINGSFNVDVMLGKPPAKAEDESESSNTWVWFVLGAGAAFGLWHYFSKRKPRRNGIRETMEVSDREERGIREMERDYWAQQRREKRRRRRRK